MCSRPLGKRAHGVTCLRVYAAATRKKNSKVKCAFPAALLVLYCQAFTTVFVRMGECALTGDSGSNCLRFLLFH